MADENFTLWTEVDPGNKLSQSSTSASFAGLIAGTETDYLGIDKGVNWKTGDFKFRFNSIVSAASSADNSTVWLLIVGVSQFAEGAEYYQSLRVLFRTDGGTTQPVITLAAWASGNTSITPSQLDTYKGTAVGVGSRAYFEMERAGTTVTLKIYSDSGYTTLVDTLTLSESAVTTLRYATTTATNWIGAGATISGDVSNLDFDYVSGLVSGSGALDLSGVTASGSGSVGSTRSVTVTLRDGSGVLLNSVSRRFWTRASLDAAATDGGAGGISVTCNASGVFVVSGLSIAAGAGWLTYSDPSDTSKSHNIPVTFA